MKYSIGDWILITVNSSIHTQTPCKDIHQDLKTIKKSLRIFEILQINDKSGGKSGGTFYHCKSITPTKRTGLYTFRSDSCAYNITKVPVENVLALKVLFGDNN